jgi:hypothetical protein
MDYIERNRIDPRYRRLGPKRGQTPFLFLFSLLSFFFCLFSSFFTVGRTSDENSFHFCSYRVRLLRAVYLVYAIRPIELVFSRPQSQS